MIKNEVDQWLNAPGNIAEVRFLMTGTVGRFGRRWVMKLWPWCRWSENKR